ncbi:acyl-[acyl-carrier-protein]--UDP-N-acetylglucosamine O-acyltransferase [Kushneria sinocarnis]|uniref:Acyl-[acyl-carrier-protein]--UDP-N-acetylglucosamine O-acyltransferase n=1 Tax=Kushneria sinocarnis TaxID=595502 RepID=A0A420WXG5_9GAMM|nr:acyl-ACP--UDP-N-acetylglucosamine O-acyltransferase [Kushneria sinocarnis]RKR04435.1 acyl-[acyl-carrier-protein]--UDP-N-acetylglucosamine O-acyltransferase [Kushneria sinocarnis]
MIHPTAIIDPGARLADDVEVGPFSVIGADVEIGSGCVIGSHVIIKGPTTLGSNNRVFQFASLGEECQDKKYRGEPTRLIVGDNNVFREGVTVHRGTVQDRGETTIGDHGWFMAYAHVAHDCIIGDHVIMANQATLGGHVTLGDHVILGGLAAIHQFCHVGAHAMCGGGSIITKDIAAFVMVTGNPARTHGLNAEGLKRRGFDSDTISELRRGYRAVFRSRRTLAEVLEEFDQQSLSPAMQQFVESLRAARRGLTR